MIPKGYCQCGCGQKTNIIKETARAKGQIKGRPSHFISGHNFRGPIPGKLREAHGYIMVWRPNHPRSHGALRRYVYEHIAIAEKILGRPLERKHPIHHPFGKDQNHCFVICEDHSYHKILERRGNALKACGHADWLKCKICQTWDDPQNLHIRGNDRYHIKCENSYRRKLRSES